MKGRVYTKTLQSVNLRAVSNRCQHTQTSQSLQISESEQFRVFVADSLGMTRGCSHCEVTLRPCCLLQRLVTTSTIPLAMRSG
jgi:hypothetical protein